MKFIYDKTIEKFGKGQLNWETADVRLMLIDTALYTPVQATHEFLSSVPAGARVGTPVALAGKTVVGRQFRADSPVTLASVPRIAGNGEAEAAILYVHTGNDATAVLIEYCDESSDGSLPVLPNGGDINVSIGPPVFSL